MLTCILRSSLLIPLILASLSDPALASQASSSYSLRLGEKQLRDNAMPTYGKPVSLSNKAPFKSYNYIRSARFAQAAYCVVDQGWKNCSKGCGGLLPKDTKFLYSSGDSQATPDHYVAYTPSLNQITISHEGTNNYSLASISNDLNFAPVPLLPILNPSNRANTSAVVHGGFSALFARTHSQIASAVKEALGGVAKPDPLVLLTGHSLGAALLLLDALALRQSLPKKTRIRADLFAPPEVGNLPFTDFVQKILGDNVSYVTMKDDSLVHGPFYTPIRNEIFFNGTDAKPVWCPGQDDEYCSLGSNDSVKVAHNGPFFGIWLQKGVCKGFKP